MTISDTLVPGNLMCEAEASRHVAALVEQNHQRNHARFRIEEAAPVERVGIVGAGFMGSVVAGSAVGYGIPVVITDLDPNALARVTQAIQMAMRDERVVPSDDIEQRVDELVSVTSSLAEVAACDLVVESIVENVTTKRTFYSGLERLCHDDTLIVSNTSTLPIGELAAHLGNPQRFCGLHYFPPIGERKILEIIPSAKTADMATSRLVQFSEQLGRIPMVVADGRGFLVNRILMAYMNAGIRLVMAGVDIHEIEAAALSFGMRMGPIRLYDEVGLDVALQCGWSLSADSATLVARTPIIARLMKLKHLGRKSGRGFFIHEVADSSEQIGEVTPQALQIIESQMESRVELSRAEVEAAILLPMVIEATKLLEIERAHSPGQVDLAVMCGFGFPASRGGPLWWADQVGAARIVETLQSQEHVGPHLRPTQLLLDTAKQRVRFYDRNNDDRGKLAAGSSAAVRNRV